MNTAYTNKLQPAQTKGISPIWMRGVCHGGVAGLIF